MLNCWLKLKEVRHERFQVITTNLLRRARQTVEFHIIWPHQIIDELPHSLLINYGGPLWISKYRTLLIPLAGGCQYTQVVADDSAPVLQLIDLEGGKSQVASTLEDFINKHGLMFYHARPGRISR
jgi:hypothetical protein